MTPIEAAAAQLREDPTLHLMTGPERLMEAKLALMQCGGDADDQVAVGEVLRVATTTPEVDRALREEVRLPTGRVITITRPNTGDRGAKLVREPVASVGPQRPAVDPKVMMATVKDGLCVSDAMLGEMLGVTRSAIQATLNGRGKVPMTRKVAAELLALADKRQADLDAARAALTEFLSR